MTIPGAETKGITHTPRMAPTRGCNGAVGGITPKGHVVPDMSDSSKTRTEITSHITETGNRIGIPTPPADTQMMSGTHGGLATIRSFHSSTVPVTTHTTIKNINYSIISFNCHGIKSSYGMVLESMNQNDCMFVCETWLRPNELSSVTSDMNKLNYWCNLKSSIDPETVLEGRPFGGVGLICTIKLGVSYIPLNTDNPMISAVQLVIKQKVHLTNIGVYMPHFDGTVNQIAQYNQALEDVQCIIDCNDPSPVLFIGDMNASMPRAEQLTRNWYRRHPFSRHSIIII